MLATDRHQHRGRRKIGEKSPINQARLAVNNFNDLQRTQRYQQSKDSEQSPLLRSRDTSPTAVFKQQLPKLKPRNRWVSLEVPNRDTMLTQVSDAHQIIDNFAEPGQERFRQRVSLDYARIEQIMNQKKVIKQTKSTQQEILQLVKQQQNGLNNMTVLTSNTPRMRAMHLQTMYNTGSSNMFDTRTSELSPRKDVQRREIPAHFEYPETDMNLTCNYFGPNDYTKKKTIDDIRMKVIEERQTKRSKDRYLNQTRMTDGSLTKNSYLVDHEKQMKDKKNIAKAKQEEELTKQKTALDQDSQGGEATPDGCKAVQIDSSFENYDPEEDLYKQFNLAISSIGQDNQVQKQPFNPPNRKQPRVKLSTMNFNGDYLVQTVTQSSDNSKQGSPKESKVILPAAVLQEDITDSRKHIKRLERSKESVYKKNSQSPNRPQEQQQPQQHVTYFAGPQINQINLHVHFNSQNQTTPNQQTQTRKFDNSATRHNVEAHITKRDQLNFEFMADESQRLLDNQNSKQTLNQSSSKALQQQNANMQVTKSPAETPFDLRPLNKYSSLQTQPLPTDEAPRTRLEEARKDPRKNEMTTSGEIKLVTNINNQVQSSILGIDLNSMNSSKSSKRQKDFNHSNNLNIISQPSIQENERPVRTTVNSKLSQNRQKSPGKQTLTKENKAQVYQDKLVKETGNLVFQQTGDKQQTEQVINQFIKQLQQQQRSATIKITTHGNQTSTKAPFGAPQFGQTDNGQSSPKKSLMSDQKQKKMKRTKYRSSTNEPKPIPQLHIYKMLAKKMTGLGIPDNISQRYENQRQLYSTMQGGFSQSNSPVKQMMAMDHQMRSTTITKAEMTNSRNKLFENGFGNLTQRSPNANMYHTIMQPNQRWNSLDLDQGLKLPRFDPHQTGFTQISDHQDKFSTLTNAQAFDRTMYRSMQANDDQVGFSLETKPEVLAQEHGESTVLFKVNPKGTVGRFRPRAKRRQESFAERNSRLGNLAQRTSVAAIHVKMREENAQLITPETPLLGTPGFALNPMMLKTDTTIFSQQAIEREMQDLEQTIITPTDTLEPQSPNQKMAVQYPDQVIYEESIDEGNAEFDDGDSHSHISGTFTTFPSHEGAIVLQPSRNQAMDSNLDESHQSTLRENNQQKKVKQEYQLTSGLNKVSEQNMQTIEQQQLQDLMGSINQRISFDSMLLEKIKNITAQQQSNVANTYMQQKQNRFAQVSPKTKSVLMPIKSANLSVLQGVQIVAKNKQTNKDNRLTGTNKAVEPAGIAASEVLEGQSILSLKHNNLWSMMPSAGASGHQSPSGLIKFGQSPRRMNQSHIVVVQTPEATPQFGKKEELKARLDIKIRCPSQLLLPQVIQAINRKLDLSISLIYFDGTQPLSSIQNCLGPKYMINGVSFNQQGFVVRNDKNGQQHTKWNLYDDLFRGQVKLEDLNFMNRQYIVEIEMTEPLTKDIYLLRYLTFNQMTQPVYQKIFITIMQHLYSKKRSLYMFDGQVNEVLDFATEPLMQDGSGQLDELFDKLVVKDISYPMVMKNKPRIECPPIRMKGIILDTFKRKVQIKGLGEFISLTDGLLNKPKMHIPHSQETSLTMFRESRQTLRPDQSDSQYVALPVTNHELQARTTSFQGSSGDQNPTLNLKMVNSRAAMNQSGYFATSRSPKKDRAQNSFKKIGMSPTNQNKSPSRLNNDSTSRMQLDDPQTSALVPCMQVKKIPERQAAKTPPRKIQKEVAKPINKQQFHIDPNLEKGIDCSFDALGSSEGRQSVNSTPPATKYRKQRNLHRLSSTHVIGEIDSADDQIDVNTQARISRQNLNPGSNMSELEDEPNDTFGQSDRLQSIFTMHKKESDLYDKMRGGAFLLIQGGGTKTALKQTTLRTNRSKDLHFKKTSELLLKIPHHNHQEQPQSKGALYSNRISEQQMEIPDDPSGSSTPTAHDVNTTTQHLKKDAGTMSTNFQELNASFSLVSNLNGGEATASTKGQVQLRPVQKSIVNLVADDVIKEGVEPAKHRHSNISLMTKKAAMRRSNMRHALADEKSNQLLANDSKSNALTIQKKQIQKSKPRIKSPAKRIMQQAGVVEAERNRNKQLSRIERDSVESDIHSIRRDSLASQFMNFAESSISKSPEVIIVNQKKEQRQSSTKNVLNTSPKKKEETRMIRYERGGKQQEVQILSNELSLKEPQRLDTKQQN